MNVHDPATWPKGPDLSYRKASSAHRIAHAFYKSSSRSFCNGISRDLGKNVVPTKGYALLCANCIVALRSWGYLSRSEVVEET
jgi:hypothetical protein